MNYQCKIAQENIAANDGRLLSSLPLHMASITYARGAFHLHKDTSRYLDFLMKTYGNGDMVSTQLLQSLGALYTAKAATYLSKRPSRPFVGNLEFFNEHFPPTGAQLRRRYVESEYSPLQAYGYSNYGDPNFKIIFIR